MDEPAPEPAPDDVAALVAEIEAEVARRQAAREYPEALLERLRTEFREVARDQPLDALAHIETVRPLDSTRRIAGPVAVFAKRLVRRGIAWYVRPLSEDQSRFNFALLRELQRLEREIARLDVPWRRPPGAPRREAGTARLGVGMAEARQQTFRTLLQAAPPGTVVVLECGDGSVLEGLGDLRVEGTGTDPAELAAARQRGFRCHEAAPLDHLDGVAAASLAAIVAPAILPLLGAADLLRAVPLAASRLREGGVLVLDAPDPGHRDAPPDPSAVDPAMVRWITPETATLLCEAAGLSEVKVVAVGTPDPAGHTPWYAVVATR